MTDADIRAKSRAIKNARFCFNCACPIIDERILVCPECGSIDISERDTRPGPRPGRKVTALAFPWTGIRLKRGGTILLAGDKGSGKTTISLFLRPSLVLISEQEPEEVAATYYRVNGDDAPRPLLRSIDSWEDIEEGMLSLQEGELAVIDSVSQIGTHQEAATIVRQTISIVRRRRAHAIFICQFNAAGQPLGANELQHAVDVVALIPNDPGGMRSLQVVKDRNGECFSTYFRLTGKGPVEETFDYAYSVEGPVSNYHLHLYPMPGAKQAGALDVMLQLGEQLHGFASAAIQCSGYKNGFGQPSDVLDRKRFAERHGLTWLDLDDVHDLALQRASEKESQ